MEIGNTGWKSFAEEDRNGGVVFGYKAPANNKIFEGFSKMSALLEVRNSDGTFCRLVDLTNGGKEKFAQGQWLAVLDSKPLVGQVNENFKAFEKVLEKKTDKALPDNRFDAFVDWTNPRIWKKKKGGYSLDISHLSPEKKDALIADFTGYGANVKEGQLSITDPKWVEVLEFEWKMAKKQKLLHTQGKHISSR